MASFHGQGPDDVESEEDEVRPIYIGADATTTTTHSSSGTGNRNNYANSDRLMYTRDDASAEGDYLRVDYFERNTIFESRFSDFLSSSWPEDPPVRIEQLNNREEFRELPYVKLFQAHISATARLSPIRP